MQILFRTKRITVKGLKEFRTNIHATSRTELNSQREALNILKAEIQAPTLQVNQSV